MTNCLVEAEADLIPPARKRAKAGKADQGEATDAGTGDVDLSVSLGPNDTEDVSWLASSSGLPGRQSGPLDLDGTLPTDMPAPLMASSPVRLRGVTFASPVASASVLPPVFTAQPASTAAEEEREDGKLGLTCRIYTRL